MPLGLPSIEFQTNKIYRAPAYLRLAVKQKLNNESIFVLGVPKHELKEFWDGVSYHALEITMPKEKGRAVVDIDSRCHANDATGMAVDENGSALLQNGGESEEQIKVPDDYYDEFKITSRKDDSTEHEKSFRLEFSFQPAAADKWWLLQHCCTSIFRCRGFVQQDRHSNQ